MPNILELWARTALSLGAAALSGDEQRIGRFQSRATGRPRVTREYDKLVRDGIPGIIEEEGETPVTHVADGDEYEDRLLDELDEEAAEYRESGDVEELADVLEVVHALRDLEGRSRDELETMRAEKAEERGRFSEGVVLERVEDD